MRHPALLLVALLAGGTMLPQAAAAAGGTATSGKRLAVVVGNNQGLPHEVGLRYAESDAQKVARVLVDLGGYEQEEVHMVLGARADELRAVLAEVEALTEAEPRPLVFFYYSGHADADDLHLDGSRLPLDEVRSFLDAAGAEVRVALVDACKSGALIRRPAGGASGIRSKGASFGPAFEIDVGATQGVTGTIVITSSSDDEVSQESDVLGGSFFTHFWVHGLYGAADRDGDAKVTLEEAYRFAHFSTVSQTIASSGGVQHPSYELDLSGEGAVIMADLAESTSRLVLSGGEAADWFVLDADRRFLLTEVASSTGADSRVKLPPGRYRIQKREADRVLVVDVELAPGEQRTIDDPQMQVQQLGSASEKGAAADNAGQIKEQVGLFSFDGHGPTLRLGGRGMLFTTVTPGPQIEAGWRIGWRYAFLEPRLSIFTAARSDRPGTVHGELDVGSSAGLRFPVGPAAFAAGLDAGLVIPQQVAVPSLLGQPPWNDPGGFLSVAGQARAFGDVAYRLWGVEVSGRVYAGAGLYKIGPVLATPVTLGAGLGVTYVFGG